MKYKFYVEYLGFLREISVLHKPLEFSWTKYNEKVSYNFVKSLDTELIFVDDPDNKDTNNKIWQSYNYLKSLLDATTSKVNIEIYLYDDFFWRGSISLFSSEQNAWDLNKKVFRTKANTIDSINEIDKKGDIEVNIQEITQKFVVTDSDLTEYDNGMTLRSVFSYIFEKLDIQLDVATTILPIISVLDIDDIFVYDKSDMKRPGATQNATITNIKLNNLIQTVCDLFNVKFEIIDGVFSFKHITEREFTAIDINKKIKGKYNNSFSYVSIPDIETLKCEEANTDGFTEYNIDYGLENGKRENYKLNDICVDLDFVIENRDNLIADPEAKDNISDTGLFLAAVNGLNIEDLNGKKNGALSYDNIFPKLWSIDRFLPRYSINNGDPVYRQTVRKIKVMEFTLDYFTGFDPVFLQNTRYGSGEVESAKLSNNKLKITLHL